MPLSIIVIGAGIVGAASALKLAQAGHRVTVIAGSRPDATSAAFGWINASFFLDADHHHLRAEGMAAWHRLQGEIDLPVRWQGCLCWDMPPDEMERTFDDLRQRGYPVERLNRDQIRDREPALLDPPDQALFFASEGAAHSPDLPGHLLRAAQDKGARVVQNVTATGLRLTDTRCTGVETQAGFLPADQVLVAAGTGSAALCESAGQVLPMVPRPAYILRTRPLPPLLHHILASPEGEVRQEPSGALLMPAAPGHQGDDASRLTRGPVEAADDAMARLRGLIGGLETAHWAEVTRAERPVPQDGFPVVGRVREGLYVATLHSGITLGPLIAELVAREMTVGPDNATSAALAPYRPERF